MEGLDRSQCALKGKGEGADPETATYTCAGCGTVVVGFGRWRNHMKRSQKAKGAIKVYRDGDQKPKTPDKKRSRGPCFAFQQGTCTRGDACRFAHDLIADAAVKSDSADDAKEAAAKPAAAEQQQQSGGGSGSRWVSGVSAAGKRQRKFF